MLQVHIIVLDIFGRVSMSVIELYQIIISQQWIMDTATHRPPIYWKCSTKKKRLQKSVVRGWKIYDFWALRCQRWSWLLHRHETNDLCELWTLCTNSTNLVLDLSNWLAMRRGKMVNISTSVILIFNIDFVIFNVLGREYPRKSQIIWERGDKWHWVSTWMSHLANENSINRTSGLMVFAF